MWDEAPGTASYWLERSDSMSGPFGTPLTLSIRISSQIMESILFVLTSIVCVDAPMVFLRHLATSPWARQFHFEFQKLAEQQGTQVIRRNIKAQHLHDVRTAINAVRYLANMPPANWARNALNNLLIKASDVQELRDRLNEALIGLHIPVLPYDDQNLSIGANGTPIKATHIEQLQERSTRGSSSSADPLYNNNISRTIIGEFAETEIYELDLVTIHLSVLPDPEGRVLFWGRDLVRDAAGEIITLPNGNAKQAAGNSEAWVWNVTTKAKQRVNNLTTNLFCSGHSFLPDGRLFVSGGHKSPAFDGAGEKHINISNPNNKSWSRDPA